MAKTLNLAFALAGKLMPSFTAATKDAAGQLGTVSKQAKAVSAATQKRLDSTAIKNLGKAAASTGKSFGKLAKEVAGTVLAVTGMATTAGAALYGIASGSANIADNAIKNAQAVGMSTTAFTELAYAAKQSGVEESQFIATTNKLNKVVKNALGGNKSAIDTLARAGLGLEDLYDQDGNLKNTEQLFAELSDTFAAMPNGLGKANLAMDIFGETGGKMVPFLNGGSQALGELREEARRFGKSISDANGRSAEAFNDSFARIKEAIGGVSMTIGKELWPALTDVHNAIAGWIADNNQLLQQKLPQWIDAIKDALPEAKKQLLEVWDSVKAGAFAIDGVAQSMGGWIPTIVKVVQLWGAYRGLRIGVALGKTIVSVGQLTASFVQAIPAMTRWIALKGAGAVGAFHRFAAGAGRAVELMGNLAWSLGRGIVAATKFAVTLSVKAVAATASFAAAAGKTVVTGLASFGKAIWTATLAAAKFSAALLANPIGLVVAAIAALVAAAIYLYYNWDEVCVWLGEAWEWMKDIAVKAFDAVWGAFESAWLYVKDIFASGWALLPGWLQGYLNSMFDSVSSIGGKIYGVFVWVWDWIAGLFTGKCDAISKAFDTGFLGGLLEIIKQFNPLTLIGDMLGGISSFITDFDIAPAAKNLVANLADGILSAWESVKEKIASAVTEWIPGGETLVNIASTGADYAKAGATAVGSAVGSAWDWGKGLFGYANGGIVSKPQLSMVGEAGPEVIVPVTRPGRAHSLLGAAAGMMGLGKDSADGVDGIIINFSPNISITGGGDAEAVGSRVRQSMERSIAALRRMLEDIMRDNRRVALR